MNSIQDAINDAKTKAEDFNSREKVCRVPWECNRVSKLIKDETRAQPGVFSQEVTSNIYERLGRSRVNPVTPIFSSSGVPSSSVRIPLQVFGFPPTEYHVLGRVEEELEPFYKLWNMISDFHASRKEWLHGSFLGASRFPV